jgi:hypothetical protein
MQARDERRPARQQGLDTAGHRLLVRGSVVPSLALPLSAAGPGPKHLRSIALDPWQQSIVAAVPEKFARGLFHSDGCRFINRVRRPLADGDRWYEYPRYMFTNESADILALCGETLDRLGVAWRYSRRNTISVARREAVARLDEFVGRKY